MKPEIANSFVFLLASATFFADIILFLLIILFIASKINKRNSIINHALLFLSQNALPIAFMVATCATLGSLFLSEIAKFIPCKLCWYQRVFIFPQVVLLGIAVWKNDYGVKKYIVALSGIGLFIALYHILLQTYPSSLPCSDEVANCAFTQFKYFGFVTIPEMSATAFGLLLILMMFQKKN